LEGTYHGDDFLWTVAKPCTAVFAALGDGFGVGYPIRRGLGRPFGVEVGEVEGREFLGNNVDGAAMVAGLVGRF
jgi:hypothetical protein